MVSLPDASRSVLDVAVRRSTSSPGGGCSARDGPLVAGPCPVVPGDPGREGGPPARVNTSNTTAGPATRSRSRRDVTTATRPRPVRPAFMVSPMLTSRKPAVNHDGTPAMDEVRSDRSTPYSCATGAGLARVAPRSTRDLAPSTVEICAEVPRIGDWATTPHASNAHETANLGHPPDVARCLLLRRPSCYSANRRRLTVSVEAGLGERLPSGVHRVPAEQQRALGPVAAGPSPGQGPRSSHHDRPGRPRRGTRPKRPTAPTVGRPSATPATPAVPPVRRRRLRRPDAVGRRPASQSRRTFRVEGFGIASMYLQPRRDRRAGRPLALVPATSSPPVWART